MLTVDGLDVFYGKSHAVRDVSLSVGSGEVVALLGRNGAGKTTTLKGVMGLLPSPRGTIRVGDQDVSGEMPHVRATAGLAYVPQGRLLFDGMTVAENLQAVAVRDDALWEDTLALFPRVRDRLHQRAGTLSGGEQQMVAIVRALLRRPRALLLDEPTTGLMPSMVDRLADTVRRLRAEGVSVLLVEEQLPFALALADRIYLMDVGSIVHEGLPAALDGSALLQRYLGVGR